MASADRIALSDNDLRFIVGTIATGRSDHDHIIELVRDKPDFLDVMLDDEKLVQRVIGDEEILIKISPRLLFHILLRRALQELERERYTVERVGAAERIPIFDSDRVVSLMRDRKLREYLADMLASFTRTQSATVYFRSGMGYRRRSYSDMDVDDMIALAELVEEDLRFPVYKRIGDACLFIAGIFPEHITPRYSHQLAFRPRVTGRKQRSLQDYEEDAGRFYRLAAELAGARTANLEGVLVTLAENFILAKKPLNLISERYIRLQRVKWFPRAA